MKKFRRLTALLLSVLMILSAQVALGLEFGEEITEGIPYLTALTKDNRTQLGTSNQNLNSSQTIVENSKYMFVVIGMKTNNFNACSGVDVYEKATGKLLTTITQATGNWSWYCPVRNIYVDNDVLYITWGNAVSSVTAIAQRANGSTLSPTYAYDVSNITEGATLNKITVDTGNVYQQAQLPFTWGGISYLDKENNQIITSKVTDKGSNERKYVVTDLASVKNVLGAVPEATLQKKYFYTTGLTNNAVKFIYKDGWLFELLHQNAGLTGVTATKTLADTSGNALNNMVYAYDLTNVEFTGTSQDVTSCLRGVYTTNTAGDNAIRDIEVIGDYLYASTANGVEVVSLENAKAETNEEAVALTSSKTLTSVGGANDLDAVGTNLFAAFEGPERFNAPNSKSSAGAIVIYDMGSDPEGSVIAAEKSATWGAFELSVNTTEKVIYVMNDTMGPPSMKAYSFVSIAPEFENTFAFTGAVTENIPHLSTGEFENSTWGAEASQMVAENENYLFVVTSKATFTACGMVQIFDKKTGELAATLTEKTLNATRYRQVRNIHVYDDILYVTWGNSYSEGDENAFVLGSTMSPVMAYDVSNVTADITGKTIFTGGMRIAAHAPFILGNISYLDEENGLLYLGEVMRKEYNSRYYYIIDTDDVKKFLNGEITSLTEKRFHTGAESKNAVKFIVKDGFLYELARNKAGMTYSGCEDTLVDSEGNPLDMIRVYDLNGKTITTTDQSVEDTLIATYQTNVNTIRDIEPIGDYLYASTADGVKVFSLKEAKEAEEALTLTSTVTLTGVGGARNVAEFEGKLIAAFEGPESFKGPNSNSKPGAIIAYDTIINPANPEVLSQQSVDYGALHFAMNKDEGIVYVMNDTMGPPSMKAYSFKTPAISFVSESSVSYTVAEGTYDINVNVANVDSQEGTIICAFYAGERLSGVAIKNGTFEGNVTVAEDYEIGADITKVKVMYLSDVNNIVMPLCDAVSAE